VKLSIKALFVALLTATTLTAAAQPAQSQKHADHALKMRKAVFSLLGSNMGPLGAMAKGKIPVDAEAVEVNATRINQLSHMIADYLATDTSKFELETEALDKIWSQPNKFAKKTKALQDASASLLEVTKKGSEKAIIKAIGEVGQSCGGCHDVFKAE